MNFLITEEQTSVLGTTLKYQEIKIYPYFSSVINSTDKVQRVYISYPIIGNSVDGSSGDNSGSSVIVENNISASTNNNNIFEGVIVAALRATDIGKFLQAELLKEFPNTAG